MTTAPTTGILDWLLQPIEPAKFFSEIYERRIEHIARRSPDFWSHLLSLDDLDAILGAQESRFPDIRLVQTGQTIDESTYTLDGAIDPVAVARLYSSGATVIFSHLQNRSKPLAQLVSDVAKAVGAPVQANVYLTPAHAQGFPAHWDTHDVFILQISGSKRWTIYDGGPQLPLRGQQFERAGFEVGPVTHEFEIQAGDLAYIPRGVVHAAHASDEASLHVTVGILSYTWADLFLEAVSEVALSNVQFRKSVAIGPTTEMTVDQVEDMRRQWQAMLAGIEPAAALRSLRTAMLVRQRPYLGNLLTQATRSGTLTSQSVVALRPGVQFLIEATGDRASVEFMDRVIDFPASAAPLLRQLLSEKPTSIEGVTPGLDSESNLVVARRLVTEGLLEVVVPVER